MKRGWLFLCLGVCLGGCASDLIEPKFPVEGKKMVVIPFKSEVHGYFDDEDGVELARRITMEVQSSGNEDELTMISQTDLVNLDLGSRDIRKMKWADIALELGADYVVVGKITRLETRLYGDVGLLRGKIGVDYQVEEYSQGKGGKVVFSDVSEYLFPDSQTNEFFGYSVTVTEEEEIRSGLIRQAAWRVGLNFYSHFPEDAEKKVR